MKPSLLQIFIAVVILELIGEVSETLWLIYTTKPLIMLLLMGWIAWTKDLKANALLFFGALFALFGDVFLMIRGANLFVPGLLSFLLMQICYIIYFSKAKLTIDWRLILPFIVFGLSFLSILYGPITNNPQTSSLMIPVVFYAIALCSMGATAALRKGKVPETSYVWVLAGAILFILSDSTIAFNRFVTHFSGASVVIMTTYAAAQWLIVRGLFKD